MSTKPQKVKPPADPDPTPTVTSSSTAEMQSVARDERKRMAKAYGRQNTILTGNTNTPSMAQNNTEKKTILGG